MILSKELIERSLKDISKKGRKIDYFLLKNLFDDREIEIIECLKKYQNPDGGFGKGLEPDSRLPGSSVVSTDMAVMILKEVKELSLKQDIIKDIVHYYESVYKPEISGWELVPPEVDDYPHAVWWNYSGLSGFTYGNPNPQVVGFLAQNKEYLQKLDIRFLVDKIVDYIINVFPQEIQKHNTLCCLEFYNYMDDDTKQKIYPTLEAAIKKEMRTDDFGPYALEPHDVYLTCKEFVEGYEDALERNLEYHFQRLQNGLIMPNWDWCQYPEEFKKTIPEWAGHLTYSIIKALVS